MQKWQKICTVSAWNGAR